MNRLPNIGVCLLAFLAVAGLAATAVMIITADRGGKASEYGGNPALPVATPQIDHDAYGRGQASEYGGSPALPVATPQIDHDAYIGEIPYTASDLVLTESQADEVENVLNSDGRLNQVLSGESFTIMEMGTWINGGELVGALVTIQLDNPVSYTGSVPLVGVPADPKSGEDYITGEVLMEAQGIEALDVLVDLNKRAVASIRIEKATGEVRLDYGKPPLCAALAAAVFGMFAPKIIEWACWYMD